MTSLFKPSAETGKKLANKIFAWGPSGAGKTHFALEAERPALLDLENRARTFASRTDSFQFMHAEIDTLEDLGRAFKEIRTGSIPCESIVVDSASAIYYKLVAEHTTRSERGAYVTDWVTVNRRFLDCLNFVFAIAGKTVIFTAHAATKLVRKGRDFEAAGLKFVGDEKFRFGFDYIFRIEPHGDPAKVPATFHVEKSSSPKLPLGAAIKGLTYAKFVEMTSSAVATPSQPQLSRPALLDDGKPITPEQLARIDVLTRELQRGQMEIADDVKRITRRTPVRESMTAAEASRLIAVYEQRLKGAA